jgi:hypothetical protein
MRVRTNDGKEGTIVERKTNQVLVKFNNGTVKGYRPEQVQEIGKPANSLKPPSRERDRLLLTIEAIEKMNKAAKESKTEFARGAEMAYSVVLEMLNELK